jgi:hypothetical protein
MDEICVNCSQPAKEHIAVPFAPPTTLDTRGTMGNSIQYRYVCPTSFWRKA